jgi:hypothetical protein
MKKVLLDQSLDASKSVFDAFVLFENSMPAMERAALLYPQRLIK